MNCTHFYDHLKLHYKSFHFHQYFHYILQLIYQVICFYTYNFYSLNILQHHMITFTFTITRIPNKSSINQFSLSINFLHSHLHLSLFQRCLLLQTHASNLHLHLQVSCHSMCLVSLVLEIRVNTLKFMFLTTSGTYNFAYGSLILLQLPLHLFTLIL